MLLKRNREGGSRKHWMEEIERRTNRNKIR